MKIWGLWLVAVLFPDQYISYSVRVVFDFESSYFNYF